jgi:hypothetical protein
MFFDPLRDFLVRFLAVCCIICDGRCREGVIVVGCDWILPSFRAIMRFLHEIFCVLLLHFRLIFPCEIVRFLLHYEICWRDSCFLAVMRCPYEICRVLLHTFLMRFPCEISCFFGRYEMSLWDFMLFCSQFSYEISWWDFVLFGAVTSFAYESSCFFGPDAISWWDFMLFLM